MFQLSAKVFSAKRRAPHQSGFSQATQQDGRGKDAAKVSRLIKKILGL